MFNPNGYLPPIRAFLAGVAFAAAVAVKPIVLPLALALTWRLSRWPRAIAAAGFGALVAGVGLYLPFVLFEGGLSRLLTTSVVFVSRWQFNSSLYAAVLYVTGSTALTHTLFSSLLVVVIVVCIVREYDLWRTTMLFFFTGLLLSSTVYPWYLLWALALVPLRFNVAVWVFSLTIPWSYVVLGNITQWKVPLWVLFAEYLPVYAAALLQAIRSLRPEEQRPITDQ